MYPLTRSTSRARFFGAAPSLLLDFLSGSLDSRITFTRASTATFFNSSGVLTSASNDVARFDYNPATLAPLGLLIEESRTNSIRNNTMVGAVAGTPGTLPTNWSGATALTGLTQEVVGTGTESGITYIDIKLSGTPSGAGVYRYFFEGATTAAALTGQSWSSAWYRKLVAGSLTGISTFGDLYQEFTSAGAFVTEASVNTTSPTASSLASQRGSTTRTLAGGATTAFVRSGIQISLTGAAIDITLRIGLPQLELGAFATSVIPTTTTALTRAADVASVNTLSPWYNAAEGTIYAEAVAVGLRNPGAQYQVTLGTSGTNENRIRFVDGNVAAQIHSSSGETFAYSTAATINTAYKTALAYKANDAAAAINGTASATDTSVTLPSALTAMYLGQNAVNTQQINGHLRRITYYPRRLANAELQSITA
jgi:hypothetical protein